MVTESHSVLGGRGTTSAVTVHYCKEVIEFTVVCGFKAKNVDELHVITSIKTVGTTMDVPDLCYMFRDIRDIFTM